MIRRSVAQFVVEFIATAADGFGMKAGDLGNPLESSMPQPHGLSGRHPAPLLLVQPAQQQIELPMTFPIPMFTRLTVRTTTFVNRR
jgi:hypothetical protein